MRTNAEGVCEFQPRVGRTLGMFGRGKLTLKALANTFSVETVVEYLNKNVRNAQLILREAVQRLQTGERECECGSALQHAIFTAPHLWPEATAKKLEAIVGKYAKR